ncbi:MAG: 4-hydroxy-tetrahydrodipicolinate reductase [bacterium]|nr:4-hydroxy-tetrahydrodipicolinate reductase [bacterium]
MIRAVVTGAAGRMGQRIIHMLHEEDGIALSGALERTGHPQEGRDAGEIAGIGTIGVPLAAILEPLLPDCDVVIDFTHPDVTEKALEAAAAAGCAFVTGTTGLTKKQTAFIEKHGATIPVLHAPNMSIGVNLLLKLLPMVAATLRDAYDVEIIEAHHHFKKDAPSGTANKLAEVIAKALKRDPRTDYTHGRCGMVGERKPREIGIHAVRGGDIIGDHTVMFCGKGERIEVAHRATSRDTFASGAVRAAKWIVGQKPGLYAMGDVLGL